MELFPYQKTGAEWLASKKVALLADDMGLGKSAQAIRAADALNLSVILVICPAIARINWKREFEKFGSSKLEPWVVSYEGALKQSGCTFYDLIIIDEAHYLKNKEAKRTKFILGKKGLVHKAERVWALTGTPCPNHPAELWPLLFTFGITDFKYHEFVTMFCDSFQGTYGLQITGAKRKHIPMFRELLKPIMLRRLKEEVMTELPPIKYDTVVVEPGEVALDEQTSFIKYCNPPEAVNELHEKLARERKLLEEAMKSVEGTTTVNANAMKLLEALANSISTLRRYSGLQKVNPVAELIGQELENHAYEKIVIFAIHRDVIEGLRAGLTRFNPTTLYGGFTGEKQQKNIDRFQNNKYCRVMIANIQCAGTSITLTAAHQVAFVEQDWVPGNNAQAVMRCHRIGQNMPVFVRFFALANTIDEKITQILKRKTRDLTEIFGNSELTNSNQSYKTSSLDEIKKIEELLS